MSDIFVRDSNLVSLMEKTGYCLTQENGQRKFGPPPNWIGPPPPKGSEIFIGKLPRDVFEDELVPMCQQFGKIFELRLMMDYSGENRGYAFVTYTNNDDATRAIKHLDDFEIRPGRHIGVCKSIDNCRLFVGGIPKDKSKEEIEAEISKYTEGVSKVILYSSILDKSKNRGFAFVEFESHRAAAMARRKLQATKIKLFDHDIAVDWAQPEAQVEEETMKRVTVLYIRNLSSKTTEEQLHIVFSMGGVLRIDRVKKLRDFAFIHYARREDAEAALERFDGIILDDCSIEVTWAKPPETQKQKMLLQKSPGIIYKPFTFDNLDHSFEFTLPPNSVVPNFSLVPRSSPRPRVQMPSVNNISSTFALTKPTQCLGYLCMENNWGNPIYQFSRIDSDPCETYYVCWVVLPNVQNPCRRFMCDKICRSPEEAKHFAACHVLRKLNIIDADSPYIGPHTMPMHSALSNIPKNYLSPNCATALAKPVPSSFGLCSPSKNVTLQTLKNPVAPSNPFFLERGQGDAGNFLSNTPSMDTFTAEDFENCASLFDTDAPIEPNSILGLISSLAAMNTNADLSNKSKV